MNCNPRLLLVIPTLLAATACDGIVGLTAPEDDGGAIESGSGDEGRQADAFAPAPEASTAYPDTGTTMGTTSPRSAGAVLPVSGVTAIAIAGGTLYVIENLPDEDGGVSGAVYSTSFAVQPLSRRLPCDGLAPLTTSRSRP